MAGVNPQALPIKEINTVADFCAIVGCNRNRAYAEIRSKRLKARKFGKRTIILKADFEAFLNSLPELNEQNECLTPGTKSARLTAGKSQRENMPLIPIKNGESHGL